MEARERTFPRVGGCAGGRSSLLTLVGEVKGKAGADTSSVPETNTALQEKPLNLRMA